MKWCFILSIIIIISSSLPANGQSYEKLKSKTKDSVFGKVKVKNFVAVNSDDLDYSATVLDDGIIFTSTRPHNSMGSKKRRSYKKKLATLFISRKSKNGRYYNPVPLKGEVNDRYHESSAVFNKVGDKMYFTRNSSKGKNKDGIVHLKIYEATKVEDQWDNIVELPFNGDDFSTCHPALSSDGNRLYFSSNRPGGFGGMDIFVSHFKRGKWQKPINLGFLINAKGNEVFPFMSEDEILYYSSNSFEGEGGLDIYRAKKLKENSERSWKHKQNLGHPFNSPKDDFAFYINAEGTEGLFTSGRQGGKGLDDIYKWELLNKDGDRAQITPNTTYPSRNSISLLWSFPVSREGLVKLLP